MPFGRRLLALLVLVTAAGVPAVALRAACSGRSCDGLDVAGVRVPFCPLPDRLKTLIAAGYREGRSPDVLGVTRRPDLWGGARNARPTVTVAWPSLEGGPSTAVPIVFSGTGVTQDARVPNGTGLDAIAPTLSDVLHFTRPHPEVRAGRAVPGVSSGGVPRLVLEVAWKGIGTQDLRADPGGWPFLRSLMREGAGTLQGDAGSLPLDPSAMLTTIGTGGLPSQHGITGTLLRNDSGALTRAWGKGAPLSVIATLPDDFDQAMGQRPLIGLVASDVADRGIIGGNWYIGHDRDLIDATRPPIAGVDRMLTAGFGRDGVPDILAVVLQAPIPRMDAELRRIVEDAKQAAHGSVAVVVTATGSASVPPGTRQVSPGGLADRIDASAGGGQRLVADVVPGGLYLDETVLATEGVSGDAVVRALLAAEASNGERIMEDAFQGFAVSFARYC